jgi:hypothetical protein
MSPSEAVAYGLIDKVIEKRPIRAVWARLYEPNWMSRTVWAELYEPIHATNCFSLTSNKSTKAFNEIPWLTCWWVGMQLVG